MKAQARTTARRADDHDTMPMEMAAATTPVLQATSAASAAAINYQPLVNQLTDGFWVGQGGRRSFDISAGDTLKVDISGLTAAGRRLANWALDAWTDASGIEFKTVGKGADIRFDDRGSSAYSTSRVSNHEIHSSFVNIGTQWIDTYGKGIHSYSMQTYIHEIGHALGLGHAGDYNGSASYGSDSEFTTDSWQASVMSYFSQDDNWDVDADYAFLLTPMVADISAIRELYGTTTIRGGNNVYSYQSHFEKFYAALTIVDTGGTDAIDLSWSSRKQLINLNEQCYSNVDGLRGNLGISEGTVIEIAKGGKGADRIIGNDADNTIHGGAGKDRLTGGGGADQFVFKDAAIAKNADVITDFQIGIDRIVFNNKVFKQIGEDGALSGGAFASNLDGIAGEADDRLIYETDTGRIYYDADGSAQGSAVLVATITAGLNLTAGDFLIV